MSKRRQQWGSFSSFFEKSGILTFFEKNVEKVRKILLDKMMIYQQKNRSFFGNKIFKKFPTFFSDFFSILKKHLEKNSPTHVDRKFPGESKNHT